METPTLLSFELKGVMYSLANNRNVVRNAAKREPAAFDSLLSLGDNAAKKKKLTFLDTLNEADNTSIIYKTLFASALVEYHDDILYENACDIYEILLFNLDDEGKEGLVKRLASLLHNEDFIKGSNRQVATVKMFF